MIRVIKNGESAMYDSNTNQAFGPVFQNSQIGEEFMEYLNKAGVPDPRALSNNLLNWHWNNFQNI